MDILCLAWVASVKLFTLLLAYISYCTKSEQAALNKMHFSQCVCFFKWTERKEELPNLGAHKLTKNQALAEAQAFHY